MSTPADLSTGARIRALSIAERLRLVSPADCDDLDRSAAAERLSNWRAQKPFEHDDYFARRLAIAGLSEQELLRRLVLPDNDRVEFETDSDLVCPRLLVDSSADDCERAARHGARFMVLIAPLVLAAEEELTARMEGMAVDLASLMDKQRVIDSLSRSLHQRLNAEMRRALVLELNVSRMRHELRGDTAETRFDSYIAKLASVEYRVRFFEEYPVLLANVKTTIAHWLATTTSLMGRFFDDQSMIQALLHPKEARLSCIRVSQGDSHKRGESVAVLEFESGGRVVYKPRALAIDSHFQQLLSWCNGRLDKVQLATVGVVDRGCYGWMEHVAYEPCTQPDEVAAFYRNLGAYLALFYALHATDFHFENLIARKKHPMFIDLESLFHPICDGLTIAHADAADQVNIPMTLLYTGLLPTQVSGIGTEFSGIAAREGQQVVNAGLAVEAGATDEMRLRHAPGRTQHGEHLPLPAGERLNPAEYTVEIIDGFAEMYRALLSASAELRASDGPLAGFASCRFRRILRPTRQYSYLLEEGAHPDFLRDAAERDRLFDKLWQQIANQPWLERVVLAEQCDMRAGDVPYFEASFDGRELIDSVGNVIPEFFATSGLELVRRQLARMSEQDLLAQSWLIESSLATLRASDAVSPSITAKAEPPLASRDGYLLAAVQIGNRLRDIAIFDNARPYWAAPSPDPGKATSRFNVGSPDLYDGQLGIALFLAHLGAVTGEAEFTDLAYGAIARCRSLYCDGLLAERGPSMFHGLGGFIYVASNIALLHSDEALHAQAKRCLPYLRERVASSESLDVLGGAAGIVLALHGLSGTLRGDAVADVIRTCADRIAAAAVMREHGAGWLDAVNTATPLTGFSHGASGYASALAVAAQVLGEHRYWDLAQLGLAYERAQYRTGEVNWLDHREFGVPTAEPRFETAWCHGAPGIGLARSIMLELPLARSQETALSGDLRNAIKATLRHGVGTNHSLCHGALGNIDFLLEARAGLPDEALDHQLHKLGGDVLQQIEAGHRLCGLGPAQGLLPYQELPGLMLGLAGIGYGLLRLAASEAVPSVLRLQSLGVRPRMAERDRTAPPQEALRC